MSQSRLGKPDPNLEGVELLFYQKGGSASFGAKMALSLNGVDPGCMNPITGSTCRAKCSNILHDIYYRRKNDRSIAPMGLTNSEFDQLGLYCIYLEMCNHLTL
jgi:hypothetical protein